MFYKPKYFIAQELVDPETFKKFGNDSLMFFNPIALEGLDDLREFLNRPLIINNWHRGGPYEFSGFRPIACKTGAEYSQHRLGNAFDIKCPGATPAEVFNLIINNQDNKLLENITAIEDINATPTWVHIDFRNIRNIPDRIRVVKS